jgi:hypothetical protein
MVGGDSMTEVGDAFKDGGEKRKKNYRSERV